MQFATGSSRPDSMKDCAATVSAAEGPHNPQNRPRGLLSRATLQSSRVLFRARFRLLPRAERAPQVVRLSTGSEAWCERAEPEFFGVLEVAPPAPRD
jgi:hypothetical protein